MREDATASTALSAATTASNGDGLSSVAATSTATSTSAPPPASASSPRRPRHQFARSLSELSSPVRLHRHHKSQKSRPSSRDQGSDPTASTPPLPPLPSPSGPMGSAGPSGATATTTSGAAITPTRTAPAAMSHLLPSTNISTMAALTLPRSSRGSLEVARPDGSSSSAVAGTAGAPSTTSASSSRRPSARASLEYHVEEALQHQQHHHHHHLHGPGHRHHSASSGMNNIAVLAAASATATVAAAGSPTPLQLPVITLARQASEIDGEGSSGASALSAASRAPLPGFVVPPRDADPAFVAALQQLHLDQERAAGRLLQATVLDLDSLSTSTSRRLDTAYGSVLARLNVLQGTVLSLRSLAVTARATNRQFTAEARTLADEVEQQVARYEKGDSISGGGGLGMPAPADQQRRLEQLHARVLAGREAVQALGGRVEAVRVRIERWERADFAWQERTRTRLKVLWAIVSCVVLAVVVLLVVMARSSKPAAEPMETAFAPAGTALPGPPSAAELEALGKVNHHHHKVHLLPQNGSAEEDPLVHVFDEL